MSYPLEIQALCRRYGGTVALDHVDLVIEEGAVLGLIGRNGAGKTTLIRHVLGLLKAQSGSVRVFGADPVKHPAQTLARIGYVSEDRDLPGWMRIEELLRYTRAFFPDWDETLASDLCRAFDLDPRQRVRTLSRGQHVRTALVLALAPRPALLVLDEPSSGLDPVVRRDVLEAVIQHVAHEGRTVLFSSHLLDEVERVSDHLVMIDRGTMLVDGPMDEVVEGFKHVVYRHAEDSNGSGFGALPGMSLCVEMGSTSSGAASSGAPSSDSASRNSIDHEVLCLCRFETSVDEHALAAQASAGGFELIEILPATLDEIFLNLTCRAS